MVDYLLKSGACLTVFYLFYVLFLEKENMHVYKRIYLIATLLIAFAIPFVAFTSYVEVVEVIQPIIASQNTIEIPLITEPETISYTTEILWSIYGLGVLLFGFKFVKNLNEIIQKIRINPNKKEDDTVSVLLKEDIVPHTFFSYIFYNKQKYITHQIPKEVVLHEQTHAKQKHSLDVLFIEFLQVLFWFNPILYLINKAMKLNHEFLADKAVITTGVQTQNYQKTLLAYSSHAYQLPLANAINYSSIKKRFTVMKTHTSKKKIWFKSIILLPVLALLLFSFSTTIQQDKATPKQVAEYNKLAKKYNEQPKNNRIIKLKDINRLEYLYKLMTPAQKKSAQPFPDCPPPPPAPKTTMRVTKQYYTYKDADGKDVKVELQFDGHKDFIAVPPPPPIPADATEEQIRKYEKTIKAYEKEVEKAHHELNRVDDFVHKGDISNIPPPMSPVEFIKHNAKKGHEFYYQGDKIVLKQAINIVKKNKAINLLSEGDKVILSKEPITVETIDKIEPERPITSINGIGCVECVLELTKEKLADIVLSVDKGEILQFKIKFPKKPTLTIKTNNVLNSEAKQFLDEAEVGQMVQIFGLKSSASKQHSPPVLFIITE
jgi:beta-lactamase regulating signal transducer with metallopeptidase domain